MKKITLPCGHHVCWRCRVIWKKANPAPHGRGCYQCDAPFQEDSITREPRLKCLKVNRKYVTIVVGVANNLPPPPMRFEYTDDDTDQFSSDSSTDEDGS